MSFENPDIDVGLNLLCMHRQPNEAFSQKDIAEVCGVSQAAIYVLEKKSWKSLMSKLHLDPLMKNLLINARCPKYHRE